ncbi:MAG: ABC transporter permease [Gemmatimonadaceae bacterium]
MPAMLPTLTDLRAAARSLLRAPAISVSAVLCIGLGLGATAALSSALDRALLRPLPFREPERLVTVYRTTPHFDTGPFSAPNYLDLARESRRIEQLAAITYASGLLNLPNDALRVDVKRATGNLFPMLGVRALRGRMLAPDDDASDRPDVAVLSEELWRSRFGADARVVGGTVRLDGRPTTVVGIAPRGLGVPHGAQVLRADVWVPMRFTPGERGRRRSNFLPVLGRLAPGATPAAASAELKQLFDGIVSAHPELRGEGVRVLEMRAEGSRAVRTPLLLLFAAVCMVLLIAATNVASLLLARGVQRGRELAVRTALGGTRSQVMRPLLVEALVLAAAGLVVGLLVAWIGVRTIGRAAGERLPQLAGLAVDGRVVALAAALSLVVVAVCGLVPAWRSAGVDPQDALRGGRGGGAGRAHHRALGALVVAEVALSLLLLLGAGLVLRGFAGLLRQEPGFDPGPILTLRATVSEDRYRDGTAQRRFLEPALEAVRRVPGVAAAGSISLLPYDNWGWNFNIRYEGQPEGDPTERPLVENRIVTPGWFDVTRQRLLAGRLLTTADDERPEAPAVVVVNEALVRRDFRGKSPSEMVGTRFYSGDSSFTTIVGVVSDVKNFGPFEAPRPEIYTPSLQNGGWSASLPIVVRVRSGDPTAVAGAVRAAVRAVDPEAAVTEVRPMEEVMARSLGRPRFYLTLLATFAGVAMVLAVAGIYGVLSYAVAQRTREFGIRGALGSTAGRTAALVARQGGRLIAMGVAVGLLGGFAATRLLRSMLFGVSPLDPAAWAAATLALAGVALAATVVPALRAARADPLVAMRVE